MGAYICGVCDGFYCSHEVNYYYCEKCSTEFCESCWEKRLTEDQDITSDICGECFPDIQTKMSELTEEKENEE